MKWILVVGGQRSGKTDLVRALTNQFRSRQRWLLTVFNTTQREYPGFRVFDDTSILRDAWSCSPEDHLPACVVVDDWWATTSGCNGVQQLFTFFATDTSRNTSTTFLWVRYHGQYWMEQNGGEKTFHLLPEPRFIFLRSPSALSWFSFSKYLGLSAEDADVWKRKWNCMVRRPFWTVSWDMKSRKLFLLPSPAAGVYHSSLVLRCSFAIAQLEVGARSCLPPELREEVEWFAPLTGTLAGLFDLCEPNKPT